jgi:Tfp pilus assembly protein PilX
VRTPSSRQRGATLLISLILLVMLTLFAISAMNTSTTNLKVVGNMQAQAEGLSASQTAIENAISTPTFASSPGNAITNPCGAANTVCTDLNGDGTSDLTTVLTPQPACVQARPQKISELDLSKANNDDVACVTAQQQGTFGVSGAAGTGDSLCGQSVWDITARTLQTGATTANSPVNVTVTQGIGVRVKALDLATNCP